MWVFVFGGSSTDSMKVGDTDCLQESTILTLIVYGDNRVKVHTARFELIRLYEHPDRVDFSNSVPQENDDVSKTVNEFKCSVTASKVARHKRLADEFFKDAYDLIEIKSDCEGKNEDDAENALVKIIARTAPVVSAMAFTHLRGVIFSLKDSPNCLRRLTTNQRRWKSGVTLAPRAIENLDRNSARVSPSCWSFGRQSLQRE